MIAFFSAKDPEETVTLSINFVNLLDVSETIVSASWLVEMENGTVVDAATLTSGLVDYSAQPIVRQKVIGGVHSTTYLHRAKVVTSAGRTLVAAGLLQVIKGA